MKHREDLLKDSDRLESNLRSQVEEIKSKSVLFGKSALWIGGGIAAVFALSKIMGREEEADDSESELVKVELEPPKPAPKHSHQKKSSANFLLNTMQEKAIVFALGLLAQRLRALLNEINERNDQRSTEEH